jgi:hypothetical protein
MNTENSGQLTKALLSGGVLALVGVGLFLLIYFGLGDVPDSTRLFTALLVPPMVIAVLVGGYYLVRRGQRD